MKYREFNFLCQSDSTAGCWGEKNGLKVTITAKSFTSDDDDNREF